MRCRPNKRFRILFTTAMFKFSKNGTVSQVMNKKDRPNSPVLMSTKSLVSFFIQLSINNTALLTNIIMIPVLQCAGFLMNPPILITSA